MRPQAPYKNIYSNDTTNIGTCTSPYHKRFGPAGKEQVRATVLEVKGQVDAHFIQLAHGQVPWYKSRRYPYSEHMKWWSEYFDVPMDKFSELGDLQAYVRDGGDILADFIEVCREVGQSPFVSLRLNDVHHVENLSNLHHLKGFHSISKFIAEHKHYMLGKDMQKWSDKALNWIYPDVPEHMLGIIREQCEDYDIDGFELDFMRMPYFFNVNETTFAERQAVMYKFISDARSILDNTMRGDKYRFLCVRVPSLFEMWDSIGLSTDMMNEIGVDMVNVSSHFYCNQWIDMKEFVSHMPNIAVYFEACHCTHKGKKLTTKTLYDNFSFRRTTKNEYYTTAKLAYEAGAKGLSFFNFVYYREHGSPPEERGPFNEPPFEAVGMVRDQDFIKNSNEHFFIGSNWGQFTAPIKTNRDVSFTMYLTDRTGKDEDYRMRVVCDDALEDAEISVKVGETVLISTDDISEPFPEDNDYPPLHGSEINSRAFIIPSGILSCGSNAFTIKIDSAFRDDIKVDYIDLFPAKFSTKY